MADTEHPRSEPTPSPQHAPASSAADPSTNVAAVFARTPQERLLKQFRARLEQSIGRVPHDEDLRVALTNKLRTFGQLFDGKPDALETITTALNALPSGQGVEARAEAADALTQSFLSVFTLEELQAFMEKGELAARTEIIRQKAWTALTPDSVVAYGVTDDTLHLHLQPAQTLAPGRLLGAFRSGLRELVRRLETDPAIAHVRQITVASWIVHQHPKIFEGMGFSVDESPLSEEERTKHFGADATDVRFAQMSRDVILQRYGSDADRSMKKPS